MEHRIEPVQIRTEHLEAAAAKDRLVIELATACDEAAVNDDIVLVMHEYGREFWDAVMPTISEAFERIILDRLRNGEYRWANRSATTASAECSTDIEDFEV